MILLFVPLLSLFFQLLFISLSPDSTSHTLSLLHRISFITPPGCKYTPQTACPPTSVPSFPTTRRRPPPFPLPPASSPYLSAFPSSWLVVQLYSLCDSTVQWYRVASSQLRLVGSNWFCTLNTFILASPHLNTPDNSYTLPSISIYTLIIRFAQHELSPPPLRIYRPCRRPHGAAGCLRPNDGPPVHDASNGWLPLPSPAF